MQTPYLPLESLDDEAVKKPDYITPQIIVNEYEKNIREGRLEAERYHRPAPFWALIMPSYILYQLSNTTYIAIIQKPYDKYFNLHTK